MYNRNTIKQCIECNGDLIEGDYEYSPERDEYSVEFQCEACGLGYSLYYKLDDYSVEYPDDEVYWDEELEIFVRTADMGWSPLEVE